MLTSRQEEEAETGLGPNQLSWMKRKKEICEIEEEGPDADSHPTWTLSRREALHHRATPWACGADRAERGGEQLLAQAHRGCQREVTSCPSRAGRARLF